MAAVLRLYVAAAVLVVCGVLALGASAAPLRTQGLRSTPATLPLRTALIDPVFSGPQQQNAFQLARGTGATYVELPASWRSLAPARREPGFTPTDPASPGYSWGPLDATVTAAEAAGLNPILQIVGAPAWALRVPAKGVGAGTPSARALGDFARALATHYDGLHGAPRVEVYEVWNEPNLSLDLSPVSAASYRAMVNAVSDAVHAVDPSNVVVAGGLDPFEHRTAHWYTQAPLAFMRSLLCLSKGAHPHPTCRAQVRFDVWSHHPYTFNGPFGHAKRPDDVSLGDLPRMRALLAAAVRLHRIVSAHPVQFWVTEFGWDTNPPRRHAAPMALAVRWTAEALYQMWRSGISLVTWFDFVDQPGLSPYQSGLYFYARSLAAARPKPVLTAFRFPFVAYLAHGRVSLWGRDPTSTKAVVTIERRRGARGPWRAVARVASNRFGVFTARLQGPLSERDWLRATVPRSGASAPFSLARPPANLRYGPWGN